MNTNSIGYTAHGVGALDPAWGCRGARCEEDVCCPSCDRETRGDALYVSPYGAVMCETCLTDMLAEMVSVIEELPRDWREYEPFGAFPSLRAMGDTPAEVLVRAAYGFAVRDNCEAAAETIGVRSVGADY